jgi:hypothetical protein
MRLGPVGRRAAVLCGAAVLLVPAPWASAGLTAGHHKTYFAESHQAQEAKIRPALTFVSGDSTLWITHSKWSKWSSKRAVGRGISHVNNCRPDCGQGHVYKNRVRMVLTRPHQHCGKRFFTLLVMHWPASQPPKADRHPRQRLTPINCQ